MLTAARELIKYFNNFIYGLYIAEKIFWSYREKTMPEYLLVIIGKRELSNSHNYSKKLISIFVSMEQGTKIYLLATWRV